MDKVKISITNNAKETQIEIPMEMFKEFNFKPRVVIDLENLINGIPAPEFILSKIKPEVLERFKKEGFELFFVPTKQVRL